MPVRWPRKPRIAIVGAGNLAGALAVALHAAGYRIGEIISRDKKPSLRRAAGLAKQVGASVIRINQARIDRARIDQARIQAKIVWFCVPDSAIASTGNSLRNSIDWTGKTALHSSGALTADALTILGRKGATLASVHPMMTFVPGSRPSFVGIPFAIEGDKMAASVARHIVRDLKGQAYPIRAEDKAAYHAWGTFASPLVTALLATTEHAAAAAGIKRKAAHKRVLPIIAQTIANYSSCGAAEGFSGPLARGDVETVKRHLQALAKFPVEREVYVALAKAALRYLPVKQKDKLRKLLGLKS